MYTSFQTAFIEPVRPHNRKSRKWVAYTDIMGYYPNDNPDAKAVCRVYRRRMGKKEKLEYEVKWFDASYRKAALCLCAIDKAKKELSDYCLREVHRLFSRAYRQYQIRWTKKHPHIWSAILAETGHKIEDGHKYANKALDKIIDKDLGNLDNPDVWKTKAAFYETWWQNKKKMKRILTPEDLNLWRLLRRESFQYDM